MLTADAALFGWMDGWKAMEGGEKPADCLENKSVSLWSYSSISNQLFESLLPVADT